MGILSGSTFAVLPRAFLYRNKSNALTDGVSPIACAGSNGCWTLQYFSHHDLLYLESMIMIALCALCTEMLAGCYWKCLVSLFASFAPFLEATGVLVWPGEWKIMEYNLQPILNPWSSISQAWEKTYGREGQQRACSKKWHRATTRPLLAAFLVCSWIHGLNLFWRRKITGMTYFLMSVIVVASLSVSNCEELTRKTEFVFPYCTWLTFGWKKIAGFFLGLLWEMSNYTHIHPPTYPPFFFFCGVFLPCLLCCHCYPI